MKGIRRYLDVEPRTGDENYDGMGIQWGYYLAIYDILGYRVFYQLMRWFRTSGIVSKHQSGTFAEVGRYL